MSMRHNFYFDLQVLGLALPEVAGADLPTLQAIEAYEAALKNLQKEKEHRLEVYQELLKKQQVGQLICEFDDVNYLQA